MSHRQRANGERGFSLVELMIAMVVLGIGLLSLAGLFPLAMERVAAGDLDSRATFHAEAKLEELKNVPWLQLSGQSGTDSPDGRYQRAWSVDDDVPAVGMKRLGVVVSWSDNHSPRQVTLATFVSDSGV